MYRYPDMIQVQTPGSRDIIVFEKKKVAKIKTGFHFGFRLIKPAKMANVIKVIEKAGGKIKATGEFVAGEPYVFFYDPDGYEVEIWFEKIPVSRKLFH